MATDMVGKIRDEIKARLKELRGYAEEHEELSAAAVALDGLNTSRASVVPRKPRGRPPGTPASEAPSTASEPAKVNAPKTRKGGKRAKRGANGKAILKVLAAHDGPVSNATIVAESGVKKTVTYPELTKLEKIGAITKIGERQHARYELKQAPATSE
jgi:hypothetical protein